MLRKTKVRIASLLSLVTGVLIFPRPSGAWQGMPAPDAASRTSVERSTAPTSQGTIATSSVKAVLNRSQLRKFNDQYGNQATMTTQQLIKFVVGQNKMTGP